MGLWRHTPRVGVEVVVETDPETCQHVWRLRHASFALPGPYVCDVCDLCGALHIDGPAAVTGPATNVADGAAIYLESLARRSPPPSA